jgi:hypothetical protein
MTRPSVRLVGCLAVVAFVGGCAGGGCVGAALTSPGQGAPIYAPMPHHAAPSPDGAAFRFAMVHDVIHERYPRHGPAYFAERERLARERLAVLHPESEGASAAADDIAVALDRQGPTVEAIALMRDKLKRQEAVGLEGKELYSSYANLGEFLFRDNLWRMLAGDDAARRRVEEGRWHLRRSSSANPDAHFGREGWQLVAVDALLDAGAEPRLLHECDLVGNRLDKEIRVRSRASEASPYEGEGDQAIYGRPYTWDLSHSLYSAHARQEYEQALNDPERRSEVRRYIFNVGGENPPPGSTENPRGRRAPFDEPALWLVGEWRQGSGPSPHLALCLGEIMLRVGQRYIAWNCYERAARLADQFSPLAAEQQFLRQHCRARQDAIQKSLPANEIAELRPRFEAEFAFGEAYQRDYQAYEKQKIQAGANLGDEHFYEEFLAGRPPIASKVGPEEWYAGSRARIEDKFHAFWSWGLLAGGAGLLLVALWGRSQVWRAGLSVKDVTPPP